MCCVTVGRSIDLSEPSLIGLLYSQQELWEVAFTAEDFSVACCLLNTVDLGTPGGSDS